MDRSLSPAWRVARAVMAAAIVIALVTQLILASDNPAFSPFNFFSYFTVLSNITAVVILTMLAARPRQNPGFDVWRGASSLYMAVTFVVYVTVLLPLETDVGVSEPWIDWIIHGIGPLFMVVDWIVNRPASAITGSDFGKWLIFPAAYLVYTLIRGPIVGWYPYPFLDPRPPHSYGEVAVGSVVVLLAILLIGLGLRWWSNRHIRPTNVA
jgi:hypothetical protein